MGPTTLQEGSDGLWDLIKSRGRGLISLCLALPWALMEDSHAEDDQAICTWTWWAEVCGPSEQGTLYTLHSGSDGGQLEKPAWNVLG